MSLPGVSITIEDGGLGRLPQRVSALGVIGVSEKQPQGVRLVNAETMKQDYGSGELLVFLERIFALGASRVYALAVDSEVTSADIDTILAHKIDKDFVALVGEVSDSLLASFASRLEVAAVQHNYCFGLVQAATLKDGQSPTDWVGSLSGSNRAETSSKRLAVCAGSVIVDDKEEPMLAIVAALLLQRQGHEGIDAVKYGAIQGISGVSPELNDAEIETLMQEGYISTRQFYGQPGYYITLARLFTKGTTDFDTIEKIRVMNRACRLVRAAQLPLINNNIPVDDGGMAYVKAVSEAPLMEMVNAGEITAAEVVIPSDQDVLATLALRVVVRVKPLGKLSWIETTISYSKEVGND